MNILALTSVYPQPDDGETPATYTVQYFCEQWVKKGNNVIVIQNSSRFPKFFYKLSKKFEKKLAARLGFNVPKKESIKNIYRVENGVKIYRFPMKKIIPHSKFRKGEITRQVDIIVKTLKDNHFKPDIIISHWVNPQIDIIIKLKKFYNARTSLVFHNDCTKYNIEKLALKEKILNIDAIGCRSLKSSKDVQNLLNLKKEPFVCYSGVPDELAYKYKDKLPSKKKNSFIYVGRLVKYKNVDKILIALSRAFPQKNFELKVIGVGGELKSLINLSKSLNIEKNVCFLGQISRKEVFDFLSKAETFIMISNNETFGMVYLEAMAMGCITIASRNGGVDGIIKNGINGYLSEQGNENDLANVINIIKKLNNKEKENMQMNAVKTAIEFSDSKVSDKYLDNIKEW